MRSCEKAWALFQEIEREGGILESLKGDTLQARIAAVRAQREKAVATRKEPITGTSEFPNIGEADVSGADACAPPARARRPRSAGDAGADVRRPPRPGRRGTDGRPSPNSPAPPRGLRRWPSLPCPPSGRQSLSSACAIARMPILARTGTRPRIFLANLGPIAAFTARATFAKNFFEAGGIEAITNDGFSDQGSFAKPISTAKPSFAASVRRMRFTKSMQSRLPKPCDLRDRRSSIWRGARVTMKMHGKAPASPPSFSPGATPSRF